MKNLYRKNFRSTNLATDKHGTLVEISMVGNLIFILCSMLSVGLGLTAQTAVGELPTQNNTDRENFFESEIRPVLIDRCLKCHGASRAESGLRLDSSQHLKAGGDSGPVVAAHQPESSLILEVLDYQHDIKMPPNEPLSTETREAFRKWIAEGVYWPDHVALSSGPQLRSGRATDHERSLWSLQPLQDTVPPVVDGLPKNCNEIDRFIASRLSEQGLRANPASEKLAMIRRVTFDLTGLPPTPQEIDLFVQDHSDQAYDRLVERLLDSSAYGEHWARHWLDVVRYSDTAGETADFPVPDAWKYRNYVIDAFNSNMPYDQFLREQIAGDILARQANTPQQFARQIVATGFIAIARRFGFDSENYHHLTIHDTIDTLSQAMLGLSFGCARCHDHKYDPVSVEDYYALYGIFESTLYPLSGSEQKQKTRSLVPTSQSQQQPAVAFQRNKAQAANVNALKRLGRTPPPTVLRSLTELDGDFELQSPASGGSRGVLVAPWLYSGPVAVSKESQSPWNDRFPAGKVGIALPATGSDEAGRLWQSLHLYSVNLAQQSMGLSLDFRIAAQQQSVETQASETSADSTTGYRLSLCDVTGQPIVELVLGASSIGLQVQEQWLPLATMEGGQWYSCRLALDADEHRAVGSILRQDGSSIAVNLPITRWPTATIDQVVIGNQLSSGPLPAIEVDNFSVVSRTNQNSSFEDATLGELNSLADAAELRDELKRVLGTDGNFEMQQDSSSPALPWEAGPNSVVKIYNGSSSPFTNYYPPGELGIHMPNRSAYDGFGRSLDLVQLDDQGHWQTTFDFRCAGDQLGGQGSWRYYLGNGPGNSAAVELFFNGSQFFLRSGDSRESVCSIDIGQWYQVQLEINVAHRSYTGCISSFDFHVEFAGQFASGWDGTIDYTFIDSYGHLPGMRPALDVDNFSWGTRAVPLDQTITVTSGQTQQLAESRNRAAQLRERLDQLQAIGDRLEQQMLAPPAEMAYAVVEGTPHDVAIQLRGVPTQPGKMIRRRMPELFSVQENEESSQLLEGSGRLALANWITSDAKHLAARVMVNRVWQQHFGRGLVRTENDFGTRGQPPTHAELLDWLACRFIEGGWSIKQLHRLILSSVTYRQSSQNQEQSVALDPENRWLWRFSPRRLSAEEIRDAMLLVSGRLDRTVGTEHPFPPPHTWGFTQHSPFYAVYETQLRSIYLMQQRLKRHPFLALFDGADPNISTARRELTTVPTQSLFLMNSQFVHDTAKHLYDRVAAIEAEHQRIQQLYRLCLGRYANESEVERAIEFVSKFSQLQSPQTGHSSTSAWTALARTLISRNEFLYVE